MIMNVKAVVAKDGSGDFKILWRPDTPYIKMVCITKKIQLPETIVDVAFIGENVDTQL